MRNFRLNLMKLQENTGNAKSGLIFGSIYPEDMSGMSQLCMFSKDKMLCFHFIVNSLKSSVFENNRKSQANIAVRGSGPFKYVQKF